VAALRAKGVNAVVLSIDDESTWTNVPANISGAVLTFALATEQLPALQRFWDARLAAIGTHVVCYSSTSVFGVKRTAETPTHGPLVDERTSLDGIGHSGRPMTDRVAAEEWALARGAAVLHLSGICSNDEGGRGVLRMIGRATNGLRNINFIRIEDIIKITALCVNDGRASGKRVCASSGAYTVAALAAAAGVDAPAAVDSPLDASLQRNKVVRNDLLRSLLPADYVFTPPVGDVQPIHDIAATTSVEGTSVVAPVVAAL
jgi:nucleoside-diphosphate-sugar epimerase